MAEASEARKHFICADTGHERRTLAGADQDIGVVEGDHRDAEGSFYVKKRAPHRRRKVAVGVVAAHELRKHLGIGFRPKPDALAFHFILEHRVVFDDAVMGHAQCGFLASVCGCALTCEGSPCVAQRVWAMPVVPKRRGFFQYLLEVPDIPLIFYYLGFLSIGKGDPCAVVPAVFERGQPGQKNRTGFRLPI